MTQTNRPPKNPGRFTSDFYGLPAEVFFQPFDPTLGTLTGITLQVSGFYNAGLAFDWNFSAVTQTVVDITTYLGVGGVANAPVSNELGTAEVTCTQFNQCETQGTFNLTFDVLQQLFYLYKPPTSGLLAGVPCILGNLGTELSCANLSFSAGSNYSIGQPAPPLKDDGELSLASGGLVLTYTYIPEPSSALLLVSGLALLFFAARSCSRRSSPLGACGAFSRLWKPRSP